MSDPDDALADGLTERIRPLLAGATPKIHGAVVADLLADWLNAFPAGDWHRLLNALARTALKLAVDQANEAVLNSVPLEERTMLRALLARLRFPTNDT